MDKINLEQKFRMFQETWTPKIIGSLNGQLLKLAKLQGEFAWHSHAEEDELFLVIEGSLTIQMRDREVHLNKGEMFIVEKGVEHHPVSKEGAKVLLFEPASTKHTGEMMSERTVVDQEWI